MRDMDKALADIATIRSHLAAGTAFRGYGPEVVAGTGVLALITALAQHFWLDDPAAHPALFFGSWILTALVAVAFVVIEMRARSQRHHAGLADAMVQHAIEQFLPIGVAGALFGILLGKFAPETIWILPGLWQVLVSLGIFASTRLLPRSVTLGGAWYFVAGFGCLLLASRNHELSPWTMGIPFVIG